MVNLDRVADNQMRVKQYLQAHGVTQPAPDQRLSAAEAKYERARLKKRYREIRKFRKRVLRDPNYQRLQHLLHKVDESNEITMGNLFEGYRIKRLYQVRLVWRRHQLLNWEHKLQVTLTDARMVDILWDPPDTEQSRRVQRHACKCLDILERVKGPFRKAFAISKSPLLLEVLGYDKNGPNPGRELEVLDQMELYTHPLDGYPVENLPSQHPLDILPFELEPNGDLTVQRYLSP